MTFGFWGSVDARVNVREKAWCLLFGGLNFGAFCFWLGRVAVSVSVSELAVPGASTVRHVYSTPLGFSPGAVGLSARARIVVPQFSSGDPNSRHRYLKYFTDEHLDFLNF